MSNDSYTESIVLRDGKRVSLAEDLERLEKHIKKHNDDIADSAYMWTVAAAGILFAITVVVVFIAIYYDTHLKTWVAASIALAGGLVVGPLVAYAVNRWLAPPYVRRRSISTEPGHYKRPYSSYSR